MARYIDANKLQKDFEKVADEPDYMHEGETWQTGIYMAGTITDTQPTADVVEVRHGKWDVNVGMNFNTERICRNCKRRIEGNYWNYCSNCGAKMDGGEE